MKCLVLIGCLFVGANALTFRFGDIIGPAGIVRPDGTNVQFTPDQADNIASAGPSGVVTKDGRNIQFTRPKRSAAGYVTPKGNIGYSGILRADGSTDVFSHDEAHNILLIGPAGIVMKDGRNLQLTEDLRIVGRSKRSAGFVTPKGSVSHAGIHRADGSSDTFTNEEAHNILSIGPGGFVMKDGRNWQLTEDLRIVGRSKRSAGFVTPKGSVSHAGIHRADGSSDTFTDEEAHNILSIGPGGFIMKDGRNWQLTEDLRIVGRSKRSAGFVSNKGNIGYSGILRADGSTDLFTHDQAHNILLIGPSGIVSRDGKNIQLTDDLRIANPRTKRHTIGESGMILKDGTQVQFKEGGVTILLEGPSGILLSDGTTVQKKY